MVDSMIHKKKKELMHVLSDSMCTDIENLLKVDDTFLNKKRITYQKEDHSLQLIFLTIFHIGC